MAYGAITLTDVQEDLSFLLGELSVPSSGIDDRARFIQRALEEAWVAYPWPFTQTSDVLSVEDGTASLPSDMQPGSKPDIRESVSGTGDDYVYKEIPLAEQDDYIAGNYRYWVTGSPPDATFNTVESPSTDLTITYTSMAPQISDTTTAPFPDSMAIAKGALRYVRMGENPNADISQEETLFRRALEDLWASMHRNQPRKKVRTLQSDGGYYTGRVG